MQDSSSCHMMHIILTSPAQVQSIGLTNSMDYGLWTTTTIPSILYLSLEGTYSVYYGLKLTSPSPGPTKFLESRLFVKLLYVIDIINNVYISLKLIIRFKRIRPIKGRIYTCNQVHRQVCICSNNVGQNENVFPQMNWGLS